MQATIQRTYADTEKIILGIDPGTNFLGYGLISLKRNKATLIATGIIDLHRYQDTYLKLGKIYEKILAIIESFHPDELAIEAPFVGKNIQSTLKLGRAQGVVIAAAIMRDIPITEYAPLKVKMAITGKGSASKEQVAQMICRLLAINPSERPQHLDATDALAVAYCHYLQMNRPQIQNRATSWADFARKNTSRVSGMVKNRKTI